MDIDNRNLCVFGTGIVRQLPVCIWYWYSQPVTDVQWHHGYKGTMTIWKSYPQVPKVSKIIQRYPRLSKGIQGYSRLSKVIKRYPRVIKRYPRLYSNISEASITDCGGTHFIHCEVDLFTEVKNGVCFYIIQWPESACKMLHVCVGMGCVCVCVCDR